MRGVTRSFWTLVAIVAAIEAFIVFQAIRSLRHVLPCWWSTLPHPASTSSCGETVALFGYNSWVPATVILALFVVTLAAGLVTFLSQVMRTRVALHRLGEPMANPERLVRAEELLDIDVELMDGEQCFCCCAGLLRPRIIISAGMLDRLGDDQLVAVLAHEREHVRRRDPAKATAVRVAASALFYLPLARHLSKKALVASELGADATAESVAGREALVGALLAVLGRSRPALGGATEMASLDALDTRIEALRTKAVPRVRPSALVLLASSFAVASLYGLSSWLPPAISQVNFQPVQNRTHFFPGPPPARAETHRSSRSEVQSRPAPSLGVAPTRV